MSASKYRTRGRYLENQKRKRCILWGHIITPKNSEFDMGNYNIVKPLPEDNILVGFQMDYNLPNDITSVVQYYFSFKMEDLGISTSTHEDVTHEYIHATQIPQ